MSATCTTQSVLNCLRHELYIKARRNQYTYIENDILSFSSLYLSGFHDTTFFLNLSETFVVNEEVTAFQKVMLKGKPVKELNDSNLNPSRQGTGPFRIRSLLIYLKQVFLQPLQLFSQDVFIQKRRYQNTFLSREQPSVHGFPFLLRGYHRLGCPQGKDNQMWNTAGTFRSYTSDTANPDHVVVIGVGRTAGSTTRSSAQGEI